MVSQSFNNIITLPSGGFFFSTHSLYLRGIINHKLIKMKQVKCADLGNDCDFVAKGSVEEVMAQVADHATGVHHMTITDDVVEAVKGVMTDV